MELRHLRSFVYVAETLSFSIAATRCFVTQSAISQHIKALEDELGCKLLIRTSHSIMLTENGEALLPRAKEILKLAEDCKEHINALNNCMTGELRIGGVRMGTPCHLSDSGWQSDALAYAPVSPGYHRQHGTGEWQLFSASRYRTDDSACGQCACHSDARQVFREHSRREHSADGARCGRAASLQRTALYPGGCDNL